MLKKMKQMLFLDVANSKNDLSFVTQTQRKERRISHAKIKTDAKENAYQEEYISIEFSDQSLQKKGRNIIKEVKRILHYFLKQTKVKGPIVIIGLGRSDVPVDSFGALVTKKIIATNQYNDFLTIPKVAIINPDVMARTGISSYRFISYVVNDLKPGLLIFIDALATQQESLLNRVIEINNAGVIPGSAIRSNKEINFQTFQIPILSIGIPLVLKTEKNLLESIYLKRELPLFATIIASAINETLYHKSTNFMHFFFYNQ